MFGAICFGRGPDSFHHWFASFDLAFVAHRLFIDQCADLVNFSSLIDPLLSLDLLGICSGSKGSESKPSTLTQSGSTTIAFCPVQRDSTFLLSGDTFSFAASNCFKSLFRLRAFPFFESPHGGAKSKPMPLRRSMRSCGLLGTAVVSVVVMMTTTITILRVG